MDFLELSRTRYSVRSFAQKAVEPEKLERILEAGRLAPTATNAQPAHIIVVKSEAARAALYKATPMSFKAPISLLVCYDESEAWHNRREDNYHSGEMDASIVCDEMMLAAVELGLGTLWARGYDTETVAKATNIPEHLTLCCILDIGYPSEDAEPSPKHYVRKAMDEFVVDEI